MLVSQHQRCGGVTSAVLAIVLLVLVIAVAIFLIPGLKDRLFGSAVAPVATSGPAASVAAVPTRIGVITAVRAKEGLPTFCLILASNPVPAIGTILQVVRNGKAHAALLIESVTGDQLTCRVTTWETNAKELVVGESVEKP